MDVISLNQHGITSVVAPLGTALTEDQLHLSWKYSTKPTLMFDGDNAGIRASYKVAVMSLPLISPKKFIQFLSLPNGYDPDSYINEVSLKNFVEKLKNPESLSHFIFNQSIKSVSLEKVDEKISYDKYLDDLIDSIKDSKAKFFYKNEFKSLFFNKIKKNNNYKKSDKTKPQKISINLNTMQNISFLAAALNHTSIRKAIIEELLKTDLLDLKELKFIQKLKEKDILNLEKKEILHKLEKSEYKEIVKLSSSKQINQLFPYSSPKFDPQESLEEVLKSINNLNTRLSNLKKINKSLNTFVSESNPLNWSDLQSINNEILKESD